MNCAILSHLRHPGTLMAHLIAFCMVLAFLCLPRLPRASLALPSHPLAFPAELWRFLSLVSPSLALCRASWYSLLRFALGRHALLANKKSKRSSRDETKRKMNENDYVVPVGGSVRHGDYMRRYHAEAEEIKYREITPSEAEEIDEKETNR